MTTQTDEMGIPFVVPASDEVEQTLPSSIIAKDDGTPPADSINTDVTVDNPTSNHDLLPANVSVYANSINPVSYMGDSAIVSFDVVFSVACTDPSTGSISTFQVVKRIGVDKMKMAHDAQMTTPISIVEAKKPTVMGTTERFKMLAGLK